MKKYIIGFGTGRCGTKSLAKLLNHCNNVNVSHEFRTRFDPGYRLAWTFNEHEAKERLQNLKKISGKLVGDTAHYYLNYIPYFSELLGDNIKFIYLHRPSEEVRDSFLKKTNKTHWIPKDHPCFRQHEKWTRTFPQYPNAKDNKNALMHYIAEYLHESYIYSYVFKKKMFVLETKDLNNKTKQKELFDFLEIPEKDRIYQKVWENKNV